MVFVIIIIKKFFELVRYAEKESKSRRSDLNPMA